MSMFFAFPDNNGATNSYLHRNLLPLVESIEVNETESYTLECLGMGDVSSTSGFVVKMGLKLEEFWNKVIIDNAHSMITISNMITVNNKKRQMDMFFEKNETLYYLECKSNVNFDSEKTKASDEKVRAISEQVKLSHPTHTLVSGYFMPNCKKIEKKYLTKYTNRGINIFGVNWLHSTLQCKEFTVEEYFTFLRDVCGPIAQQKLNIKV